jgi:uncharacterized membrane protein SirB2
VQETPDNISDLRWLKLLRLFCFAILLMPTIVLVISGALMTLNSNAGWLRYPLPGIFFVVYVVAGLSSPLIGIAALIILLVTRHKFKNEARREQRKLKNHILVLGMIDIFVVIAWVVLFPLVFFSAGGSR